MPDVTFDFDVGAAMAAIDEYRRRQQPTPQPPAITRQPTAAAAAPTYLDIPGNALPDGTLPPGMETQATMAARWELDRNERRNTSLLGYILGGPNEVMGLMMDFAGLDQAADQQRQAAVEFRNLGDNMTAGFMGIPGDLANIVGLGGAVIEDAFTRQSLGETIFENGGEDAIADYVNTRAQAYVYQHPEATEADVQQFYTDLEHNEEYRAFVRSHLRAGLDVGTQIQAWAARTYGAPMPEDATALDDFEQIFGGALAGLPTRVAQGVVRTVVPQAVRSALDNTAGRVAGRVAEALTPLTMPYTPGNVAANTIVGAGINEVIRDTQGIGGLIDFEHTTPPDERPLSVGIDGYDEGGDVDADTEGRAIGAAGMLSAIFGLAFRGRISGITPPPVSQRFGRTIDQQVVDTNVADPGHFVTEGLGPSTAARNITNAQAPITDAVRTAVGRGDTLDDLESLIGTQTGTAGEMVVDGFVRHGRLPGLDYTVLSPLQWRKMREADPATANTFDQYMFAQQALDDRLLATNNLSSEIARVQLELTNAVASGAHGSTINALRKNLFDLMGQRQRLRSDLQMSRPSLEDLDNNTAQGIVNSASTNPEVMRWGQEYRKGTDAALEYAYKAGYISHAEFGDIRSARSKYVPLHEDPYTMEDASGNLVPARGLKRTARIFGERLKAQFDAADMRKQSDKSGGLKSRNLAEDKTLRVNNPINPIDAMQKSVETLIRSVQTNTVRREIIDELMKSPWGNQHIKKLSSKNMTQFTPEQVKAGHVPDYANHPATLQVRRQGKIEFYHFGDQVLRDALEFAPPLTVPILNKMRRLYQGFTTGMFAPWFALKAMTWETQSAQFIRREGRSFGMIDTLIRRVTRENQAVSKVMDRAAALDPTSILQVVSMIPRSLLWRSYGAIGEKITNDLITKSGIFATLANASGGKYRPLIKRLGSNMVRAYDQSAIGVLLNHNFGHAAFLTDPLSMKTQFDKALKSPNVPIISPVAKAGVAAWSALFDAVHNAAKYAFFTQNYARLEAASNVKRTGLTKAVRQAVQGKTTMLPSKRIPKKELTRLVNDTRQLSGDMARVGGSNAYNKVAGAVPYSNVAVQATRHLFREAGRHWRMTKDDFKAMGLPGPIAGAAAIPFNPFAMRLIAGLFIPTVIASFMMNNWDDEAREYWNNQVPTWQRISNRPVPTLETAIAWANGEAVPFSRDAIKLMPIAPEFIPLNQAFMAGLTGLGITDAMNLTNGQRVPPTFLEEMRAGLGTLVNVALPPAAQALLALNGQRGSVGQLIGGEGVQDIPDPTFGGAHGDRVNINSDISRSLMEVIAALAGTGMEIGIQMVDAWDQTTDEGGNFRDALNRAFDVGYEEIRRRTADAPMLFNNNNQLYKFTPVAEELNEFEALMEPVYAQRGVETDTNDRQITAMNAGMDPYPTIQDPVVREMVEETQRTFRRGRYADLDEELANLNALLTGVDGQITNFTAAQRAQARDAVIANYQAIQEEQLGILQDYTSRMQGIYGAAFEQNYGVEWTPQNFARVVDLVTQRPTLPQ